MDPSCSVEGGARRGSSGEDRGERTEGGRIPEVSGTRHQGETETSQDDRRRAKERIILWKWASVGTLLFTRTVEWGPSVLRI